MAEEHQLIKDYMKKYDIENPSGVTLMRTLEDGTKFTAIDGGWSGTLVELGGTKYIRVHETNRIINLDIEPDLVFRIKLIQET